MDEKTKRQWVIDIAMKYYGRWYIWGGDDPSGFDCSGFVIECLKSVGILPRQGDWTAEGLTTGFGFRWAAIPPVKGDLVFWQNNAGKVIHVEICLSDGLSIGASGGGSKVRTVEDAIEKNAFIKIRPINSRPGVWGYLDPYK